MLLRCSLAYNPGCFRWTAAHCCCGLAVVGHFQNHELICGADSGPCTMRCVLFCIRPVFATLVCAVLCYAPPLSHFFQPNPPQPLDPERQKECEELLGPLPSERFAELVVLGKLITDYVGEGEAVVGPNDEDAIDEDIGVAVEVRGGGGCIMCGGCLEGVWWCGKGVSRQAAQPHTVTLPCLKLLTHTHTQTHQLTLTLYHTHHLTHSHTHTSHLITHTV